MKKVLRDPFLLCSISITRVHGLDMPGHGLNNIIGDSVADKSVRPAAFAIYISHLD